jgi:hypothetical protein
MSSNMTEDEYVSRYMNKQLKKNKLPYGLQYLNWRDDQEEKAQMLYKAYIKRKSKIK